MKEYCDRGKVDLGILTDLHVSNPPEYEKVVSAILAVYLYVWMCAPMVRRVLFV
jgi:hypothetical protein